MARALGAALELGQDLGKAAAELTTKPVAKPTE
jgi:hypothetical protein